MPKDILAINHESLETQTKKEVILLPYLYETIMYPKLDYSTQLDPARSIKLEKFKELVTD